MRRALPLLLLIGCGTGPGAEPTPTPLGEPLPACDEAEPGFDSIRPGSGVDFVSESGDDVEVGGLVLADLDGDGPSDLLLFQRPDFEGGDGAPAVFWGNGDGTFEPHDGALPSLPGTFGATTGDVDGDGDLDVLLFGGDYPELWLTDGRAFEDAGEAWGLHEHSAGEGSGGSLGDVDGDGDLDLLVHDGLATEDRGPGGDGPFYEGPPNRLYRNVGDGFEAWPGPWEATNGITHHAFLHDADRDGDLDILSLHDGGNFGNNSEHWEQTADGWTVHAGFGVLANPMGGLLEDLDGDGADDLITTDIGSPRIFAGDDAFGWIDVGLNWLPATEHGPGDTSWSVLPLDADLDGRTDLLITYGRVLDGNAPSDIEYPEHQPDRLFLDVGDGTPRYASIDGLPPNFENNARGAAADDLDGDGMPDVVVRNITGPPSILRGRCVGGGRLAVELWDAGSADPFAVGAEVTVHSAAGVQRRRVTTSQGTYTGTSPRLHFGVGDAEQVDRIVVRWPDGGEDEWTDVCVPCRVRLERP